MNYYKCFSYLLLSLCGPTFFKEIGYCFWFKTVFFFFWGGGGSFNSVLFTTITLSPIVVSEVKLDEAAVLHYTYAKFSDLTSRRDRCGCKPTKEDVKRCFMLEFDRSVSSVPSIFACCLCFFYLFIFFLFVSSNDKLWGLF